MVAKKESRNDVGELIVGSETMAADGGYFQAGGGKFMFEFCRLVSSDMTADLIEIIKELLVERNRKNKVTGFF